MLHAPVLTVECRKRSFHIGRKPPDGLTVLFVYLQIDMLHFFGSCICKTDVSAWPLDLRSCWGGENRTQERCLLVNERADYKHLPNHYISLCI